MGFKVVIRLTIWKLKGMGKISNRWFLGQLAKMANWSAVMSWGGDGEGTIWKMMDLDFRFCN